LIGVVSWGFGVFNQKQGKRGGLKKGSLENMGGFLKFSLFKKG